MNTTNVGTDTVFVDDQQDLNNQVVQYRVLADANEAGLITSVSNQVVVTKEANLFYPTAFTPDGVGPVQNETFTVFGQYIVKMELKIFDRWGAMIFFSDANKAWNGTQSGRPMPEVIVSLEAVRDKIPVSARIQDRGQLAFVTETPVTVFGAGAVAAPEIVVGPVR